VLEFSFQNNVIVVDRVWGNDVRSRTPGEFVWVQAPVRENLEAFLLRCGDWFTFFYVIL
jgi:hypothetical protein